jgi:hypothetical protein
MSQQDWLCLAIGIAFFYLGTKVPNYQQNETETNSEKDDNK